MHRQNYESARDSLLTSSFTVFNWSGQRFLDACSNYGPARQAIELIQTKEIIYDEVRSALERSEDPTPAQSSDYLPFCYGLFRAVIKAGEDAAPLLGNILSGCNRLDDGLNVYRSHFLGPLIGYIDDHVARAETKRTSRSDGFSKAVWFSAGAVAGVPLTKLGEWFWTTLSG